MNLRFQRKQLSIPYVIFLLCFVIAPVLVVFTMHLPMERADLQQLILLDSLPIRIPSVHFAIVWSWR